MFMNWQNLSGGGIPPTEKEFREMFGNTTYSHFFGYKDTYKQWHLCSKEKYDVLIDKFKINEWEGFREWEDLKKEYNELRYKHFPQKEHNNILSSSYKCGQKLKHPCQKPIDILERLIKTSTNEDDVVLDCFMGSGSTGVACITTNRKFYGIEKDENYFEIAKNRIEETIKNKEQ